MVTDSETGAMKLSTCVLHLKCVCVRPPPPPRALWLNPQTRGARAPSLPPTHHTHAHTTHNSHRTSTSVFLKRGEDAVVARVEARLARHAHLPASHGEPFEVLHYARGQQNWAHYDAFTDDGNVQFGGNVRLFFCACACVRGGCCVFFARARNNRVNTAPHTPKQTALRDGAAVPVGR